MYRQQEIHIFLTHQNKKYSKDEDSQITCDIIKTVQAVKKTVILDRVFLIKSHMC